MQWAKDERGGVGVDLAADAAMGLSGAAQRHRPTATALAGEAAGGQGAPAELNAADADAFARRNEISEESKSGGGTWAPFVKFKVKSVSSDKWFSVPSFICFKRRISSLVCSI